MKRRARPRRASRADKIRNSARWKALVPTIKARDGGRCTYGLEARDRGVAHFPDRRCPVTEGLDVHHVTPIEEDGEPFDPENLRTLCGTHHEADEKRGRLEREQAASRG